MNNQRRHHLEQNVLANYLGSGISKTQSILKPAAIVAAIAGLAFLGYTVYQSVVTKNSSESWTEYYFNLDGDAESFAGLAEKYGDSPAGQWARFSAASGFLTDGVEALYTNRQEGLDSIKKAIAELDAVKDSRIPELRRQALDGLSQAHESLGQLKEASSYIDELLAMDSLPESQREQLSERLKYLNSSEAKQFYEWFAKLDPKPAAPPQTSGDLGTPPTKPTISFDQADLPKLPSGGAEAPAASEAIPQQPDVKTEPNTETPPSSE